MFALNPLVLASSTNEAENGNHPHLFCDPVRMRQSHFLSGIDDDSN